MVLLSDDDGDDDINGVDNCWVNVDKEKMI